MFDSNAQVDVFGLEIKVSIELQSYIFKDTRVKGIHSNVYIGNRKKTEALLDIDADDNLYWKRFGDLNISKNEKKPIDKAIKNIIHDNNIMQQAKQQLEFLIKDLEKNIKNGTKGDKQIAERNIGKFKKTLEILCKK